MITGEYNSRLHICYKPPLAGQSQNAVAAIKAIRTVTGNGLKEAKDMWDDMKNNGTRVTLTVDPDKLKTARTELINGGLTVA
jgi:ribosomal protein L7/L12